MKGGVQQFGRTGVENPAAEEIRACLDEVLRSPEFASSHRCLAFLRFVVERALEHDDGSLKESVIAREVFGRPEYDPNEDSFVRVKALDVRRRLTQYYEREGPLAKLRIELPVGRYQPRFYVIAPPEAVVAAERPGTAAPDKRVRLWWTLSAIVILALAVISLGLSVTRKVSLGPHLDRIWRPVFQLGRPLVIFVPIPNSFELRGPSHRRYSYGDLVLGPKAPAGASVAAEDIYSFPDKVGLGAAHAAVSLSVLCERYGEASEIKFGHELALSDLRSKPAVILGAFSSSWPQELNNQFRFQLKKEQQTIGDSQAPGREWSVEWGADQWPVVDYAIAARILHPMTKHYVFIASGITTFGTQIASEFLTNEADLKSLDAQAPKGWEGKNFQVVLRTRVIGNSPSSASIVAVNFW